MILYGQIQYNYEETIDYHYISIGVVFDDKL